MRGRTWRSLRAASGALLAVLALAASCGPAGSSCPLADGGACLADAGPEVDAGAVTLPPGPAIVADAGTWTWVDFPDSECGNGSPTGLGLNPSPAASTELVLYLQGGGACWNTFWCFTLGAATHLTTGYTATTFAAEPQVSESFFDRALPGNPFQAASFVFIPYCTGDVHAGDSVQTYAGAPAPVHHHGARNLEAYLARLRSTFPGVTTVYLTGSSAGAFGAQLGYGRVVAAFPSAAVHVLADSGQMINPSADLLSTWLTAWSVTLPAGCPGCATDFAKYPGYLATTYPTRRFALLAYTQDFVLTTFFNRLASDFEVQTRALLASAYDPHPNAHYFLLTGAQHTMLASVATLRAPGGTSLLQFLQAWKTGDPAWASVTP